MIDFDAYYNKLSSLDHRGKPKRPHIPRNGSPEELRTVADKLEEWEKDIEQWKIETKTAAQTISKLYDDFQKELFIHFCIEDLPQRFKIWNKACELNRSNFRAMFDEFEVLLDFLKDCDFI